MPASPLSYLPPPIAGVNLHPYIWDMIDLDATQPQYVQRPTCQLEIRSPGNDKIVAHTLQAVDSFVRTNSYAQKSQTLEVILHNVPDLIRATGRKPLHSMYRVELMEGYSGVMQTTFSGWINEVDYSNAPAEVHIMASDLLQFTRRFFILSPLDYQNWLVEDAVRDLLSRCGIQNEHINIGIDGQFHCGRLPQSDDTLGKNGAIFDKQTVEAALGHILDVYGWRVWCDATGHIQFQYVRPFPDAAPTQLPAGAYNSAVQRPVSLLTARAATARFSAPLPGNLIKTVSHKISSDDMRNFVAVYDGVHDPPYMVTAAPGTYDGTVTAGLIAGFPAPCAAVLSVDALRPADHNSTRLGYYTSATLVASDTIDWDAMVLAHPNSSDASTVTMQQFLADRILYDLNREQETAEVLTYGNPLMDIGMTVELGDPDSFLDGNFMVQGYQTRMSASGYTTQIKCQGGPSFAARYPEPRPAKRPQRSKSGGTETSVLLTHGRSSGVNNAFTITAT